MAREFAMLGARDSKAPYQKLKPFDFRLTELASGFGAAALSVLTAMRQIGIPATIAAGDGPDGGGKKWMQRD